MPFVGYGVYRLLSRGTALTARRRAVAAGVGAYVGLNVAALVAAIEFGLQPDAVPHGRRHAAVRAVPPLPDDPGDGARPPRRWPASSRSRSRPASSPTCSGPTCRCCGSTTPTCATPSRARRAAAARLALGPRRRWRDGAALAARAARARRRLRRGRAGRSRPAASTTSTPCRRASPTTTASGATPLLGGYGFADGSHRTSATCCRPSSAHGGRRRDRRLIVVAARRPAARPTAPPQRRGGVTADRRRRTGCCSRSSACARAAASAGAARASFVAKTIAGGARRCCSQVLFARGRRPRPGLLQRIDPRVKVRGAARPAARGGARPARPGAGRRCTRHARRWPRPRGCRCGFFVKRVWLFIPIFTGIVVLPATLNFVTPGDDRRAARHWFGRSAAHAPGADGGGADRHPRRRRRSRWSCCSR